MFFLSFKVQEINKASKLGAVYKFEENNHKKVSRSPAGHT